MKKFIKENIEFYKYINLVSVIMVLVTFFMDYMRGKVFGNSYFEMFIAYLIVYVFSSHFMFFLCLLIGKGFNKVTDYMKKD